jgi:uncharacterized cupredoxin-like copper-binding protein
MSKRTALFGFVIVLLALALAACSPKVTSIEATMTDFKFTPDQWEVAAGGEVSLTLINEGTQEHEYVIMILGKDATVPFDDDDEGNIFWEHELQPGETGTVTFTAPSEPGEYHIVCGTAGHLEAGMRGTLTVK